MAPGFGPFGCLALGQPNTETSDGCLPARRGFFVVAARCAPRRIVILGLLAHRDDRLTVILAGGREVRARTAPVPADVRKDGAAALVVLGPHDAPRELILRGRSGGHARLTLPPAAAQCGYETFTGVGDAWPFGGQAP
jgi:hypothetical protein